MNAPAILLRLTLVAAALVLAACTTDPTSTPSPATTPSPSATATASPTVTTTPVTPSPSPSPAPSPSPTPSPTPASPTAQPTPSATATATRTPTPTATPVDDGWAVDSIDVDIRIRRSGTFVVVERIVADFGEQERHGIFRSIQTATPVEDQPGMARQIGVTVRDVVDANGIDVAFDVTSEGGFTTVRMGDPEVLVTGRQVYVLTYVVAAGLTPFDDHDGLTWPAVGADWPVPVLAATAVITLPTGVVTAIQCGEGSPAEPKACDASYDERRAEFAATRELPPGEALVVGISFPKGTVRVVPPVIVDGPQ